MLKICKNFIVFCIISMLVGCSIANDPSAVKLNVETKMSDTIFLDPVPDEDKTVLINMRNTSGYDGFDIQAEITNNLINKGYKIVSDPRKAYFILQINILHIGAMKDDTEATDLSNGFGSAIVGAGIGGMIGHSVSGQGNYGATIAGAGLGALGGTLANAMLKPITYSIITDIQISERSNESVVQETGNIEIKRGTGGNNKMVWHGKSNFKKYQTRIVSKAKKINLKLQKAMPALKHGLINAISGLL